MKSLREYFHANFAYSCTKSLREYCFLVTDVEILAIIEVTFQVNPACPANSKPSADEALPLALPLIDPWTKLAVGCGDDDISAELCAQSFLPSVMCADLGAEDLPPVSCRPPVRRQLQSAEQR